MNLPPIRETRVDDAARRLSYMDAATDGADLSLVDGPTLREALGKLAAQVPPCDGCDQCDGTGAFCRVGVIDTGAVRIEWRIL